jgi:hypothetical protein
MTDQLWRLVHANHAEDLIRLYPEHFGVLVLEDQPDTIALPAPHLDEVNPCRPASPATSAIPAPAKVLMYER